MGTAGVAGVVRRSAGGEPRPVAHGGDGAEALTEREQQVLRLVSDGLSNQMISQQLGLSPHTVNSHLRTGMRKLGAPTRTAAVHAALLGGVL